MSPAPCLPQQRFELKYLLNESLTPKSRNFVPTRLEPDEFGVKPVLAIASQAPVRIIGCLRPPHLDAAGAGIKVRVRTRGSRRESATAIITELGTKCA